MLRPDGQRGVRAILAGTRDLIRAAFGTRPAGLTAEALLGSGLIGLWKDRSDIGDSLDYARWLRRQAEQRQAG